MSQHQLYRHSGVYNCSVCQWQWQSKPKTECPGVERYDWGQQPDHIMSESRLNRAGYKLVPDQPVRGIVQSGDGKNWYDLYSIHEATPKPRTKLSPSEAVAQLQAKEKREMFQKEERTRVWHFSWELQNRLDWIAGEICQIERIQDWAKSNERDFLRGRELAAIKTSLNGIARYSREAREAMRELFSQS